MTDAVLGFDQFAAHLADRLGFETGELAPDALLVDDLGLDSFDLVELLAMVEDLGVHFPDDVAVALDSVADVYREYEARARRTVLGG